MRVGQELVCVDDSGCVALKLHKVYAAADTSQCPSCGQLGIAVEGSYAENDSKRMQCFCGSVMSVKTYLNYYRPNRFVPIDELPMPPKEITEPEPMQLIEALAQKMSTKETLIWKQKH